MVRARMFLLAVLLVWGLLSGSALVAIFPTQFQVVEEHEEKPHRAPTGSLIQAQAPRDPRVSVEPVEAGPRIARLCRRSAVDTIRLAQHVRAERLGPLRL